MFHLLRQSIRFVALLVILLLVVAGCGGSPFGGGQVVVVTATPAGAQPTSTPPSSAPGQSPAATTGGALSVSQIVDKLRPSTALIDVQESTDFGGTGSGFVYDQTGLIVTNAHVVTGGALIKVHLQGSDRWLSARVIGIDPCADLAIIQVDGGNPVPATMGSSDAMSVGDEVVAIGYPKASQLGTDVTVTRGVVSKLHASIGQYDDVIQTDAAINPGNSGGPLLNMKGEVVGINTATLRGTTGINFSISISAAKPILTQLATGKKLNYLGWNLVPNDSDLATQNGLSTDKGMVVAGLDSGSPVSRAGIQPLDVIYDMETIQLTDNAQVCDILRSHTEGAALKVSVVRGKQLFSGEINGQQLVYVRDLSGGTQATAVPPTSAPASTAAPAVTAAPRPTSVPAAGGRKYGPAAFTAPQDGYHLGYACRPFHVAWSGPTLGANEWFLVEATKQDHPNEWFGVTDWTQDFSVDLGMTKVGQGTCFANFFNAAGIYIMRIRIVRGDKSTHTINADIAPPSGTITVSYG